MATSNTFQRGFTYLSLLFFVAVLGVGLAATATSWQTERQRQKERELLAIGYEFRDAIALYYQRSPGAVKQFPHDLNDLLKDSRYPMVQRYLRRIYRDPLTGKQEWGTVAAPDGGIIGIYSRSTESPLRKSGFMEIDKEFANAVTYADWKFIFPLPVSPIENTPNARLPVTRATTQQ